MAQKVAFLYLRDWVRWGFAVGAINDCLRELLRKRHSVFEFSLCLSRACLGKKMHFIYKWHRKKIRFHVRDDCHHVQQRLRENGTFFEFSLCLSRACLGKIMHFIYKWLKKCRFLATNLRVFVLGAPPRSVRAGRNAAGAAAHADEGASRPPLR